jgi:amidase
MTDTSSQVGQALPSEPDGIDRRDFLRQTSLVAGVVAASTALAGGAPAATAATDITGWNADTLAARIKAKDVSCVEVMDAYLGQIRQINPQVNAIVALQDEAGLRAQAAERDRQLKRGEYLGWMHGMPQAIKDTAEAKGLPYTSGSPLLKGYISEHDSVIVERARKAGAIIIGKTNVPEFALGSNTYNPVYGPTVNPYDLKKTVGGSSGGAAAALAAHMLPVADGSDMGGSIRNPAAYCNVYGLRPGAGTVPMAPSPEVFIQQFAIEGPMGRTVKDVAMLLSIQSGHDPRAPLSVNLDPKQFTGPLASNVKGKRIAWIGDWNGYFATEPGVLDLCKSSLRVFEGLGCAVEDAVPDFSAQVLWADVWLPLRAWIMGNYLGPYYADPAKRPLLSDNARWEVEQSFKLTHGQIFAASVARTAWAEAVRTFFERYDFAIAPTAQVFPFDVTTPWPKVVGGRTMETYHQWMGIVLPWTLAGTPVMNAPAGFSATGLPMGIQIIGKRQAELAVLKMAFAYEAATGWVQKHPAPILGKRDTRA